MSLSSSMNPSLSLITKNPNPSLKILPNLPIKIRANPNPRSRICFTNLRFTPQLRFSLKVNGVGGRDGGGGYGGGGYGNGAWGEDDEEGFGRIDRFLLLFVGALSLALISLILSLTKSANEERKQCEPMEELKASTALLDEYRRFRNLVIKALNLGEEFMVEELKEPVDFKAEELENYRRQKLLAAGEDNDQVTTTNVGGGGVGGKSVVGAQDGVAKLVQLRCGESANLTIVGGEVRELNKGEGAEIEILFPRGGGKLHIKSEGN